MDVEAPDGPARLTARVVIACVSGPVLERMVDLPGRVCLGDA